MKSIVDHQVYAIFCEAPDRFSRQNFWPACYREKVSKIYMILPNSDVFLILALGILAGFEWPDRQLIAETHDPVCKRGSNQGVPHQERHCYEWAWRRKKNRTISRNIDVIKVQSLAWWLHSRNLRTLWSLPPVDRRIHQSNRQQRDNPDPLSCWHRPHWHNGRNNRSSKMRSPPKDTLPLWNHRQHACIQRFLRVDTRSIPLCAWAIFQASVMIHQTA